ncbi:ComF family protein [Bacillus sp. 2205SS5-2]|uniref:ComF family protein n=1 Tax=Bacillus sp. 2205SS5-2 TaxID=3109031 RepID=UPI0030066713
MRCIYCHQSFRETLTWSSFLFQEKERPLCEECQNSFELVGEYGCDICSRLLKDSAKVGRCPDCIAWESHDKWSGTLSQNRSIFLYNESMKNYLAQYKYRGDYELSCFFRPLMKKKIASFSYDELVPIPVSSQRLYERGFNQVEGMLEDLKYSSLLTRKTSEKQSKKTKQERMSIENPFLVERGLSIAGKKIVLVDDIYTTGSTLRQAAKVLKNSGARHVCSVTLVRG